MYHIKITLDQPICRCDYNHLEWGFGKDKLLIRCANCKVTLDLGGNCLADIQVTKGYPKGRKPKPEIFNLVSDNDHK
jgi:hypothetical protein